MFPQHMKKSKSKDKPSPQKKISVEKASAGVVVVRERPLSPHPTVYKPQISSVLSISHRISGVFLTLGALLLSWWVISIACGPGVFAVTNNLLDTRPGYFIMFCWTLALYYHLLNGIRHLFWDIGLGFDLRNMAISGFTVIILSISLAVFSWYYVFTNLEIIL